MLKPKKISSNVPLLFYSIVASGLLFLLGLWFFLHPNSPWHSRNHYLISFKEIGNLKVGDAVNVGGLRKGYVEELDLTDSCVWVRAAVLAEIKIPLDSKARLVNVGLMGKRAVEMELGKSNSYHANKARIAGHFDIGSTSIGILTVQVLDEAMGLVNVLSKIIDSLSSEEKIQSYKRLGKKGGVLGKNISRIASLAENSLENSIDSLIIIKDKTSSIIDNMKTDFDGMAENLDLTIKKLDNLGKSISGLKTSIEATVDKLENGDNTLSTLLNNEKHELKKLSEDAAVLMKTINARGLDINADFF
ncbi:MAG: MlaD family protein [Fibromonadaceae bacterium]|jgi:phospholipid/cholesterol/gamma-HCH transport system substrate-binding protein|nr:MlaD family protein [Fibromonadaceae bacterium]